MTKLLLCGGAFALTSMLAFAQAPGRASVYEGGRLIIGDGRAPIRPISPAPAGILIAPANAP